MVYFCILHSLSACHSEAVLITKGLLPGPHGIALQFGLKH